MSKAKRSAGTSPELRDADRHDLIRVHGARVNNLKDVSIDIPKRRLTAFTGVSGSGKSSLVFGTIAAESQRLINETYSTFVQGFMPTLARPEVDVLEGLTTAIIVDQERMGANPRSTVGTATDANAMLRIIFSRLGQPHIGSPQAFSFNTATISGAGAVTFEKGGKTTQGEALVQADGWHVPAMRGHGQRLRLRPVGAVRRHQVAQRGRARRSPATAWTAGTAASSEGCGYFDPDKPIKKFTKKELNDLLYREPTKIKVDDINLTYEGVIPKIQKSMLSKDVEAMQPHIRAFVERVVTFTTCPDCGGTGSTTPPGHRRSTGRTSLMPARCRSATWPSGCARSTSRRWRRCWQSLGETLDSFVEIGLGYLSLNRPAGTLSGGEAQRTKMIRHLGSSLTDVTYVFDEPTIGLHPHDIARMNDLLVQLRDKGNTVLVVEHKPEAIGDRRPRRRSRARGGHRRRRSDVRGQRRGAAGQRHRHGPPLRRPSHPQGDGAHAHRRARGPRRDGEQPPRPRPRHPARRAGRPHGRRRIRGRAR